MNTKIIYMQSFIKK